MFHKFSQSSALIEVTGNGSEEGGVLLPITEACTGGKVAYLTKREKRQNKREIIKTYMSQNLVNVLPKRENKVKESQF